MAWTDIVDGGVAQLASIATAHSDGIDALNAAQVGRTPVEDWVADDAEVFSTGQLTSATHLTGARSHVFFLRLSGLLGDHQFGSFADGDAIRILNGTVYIVPASDDGSEPLKSVGDTSTIPINKWFIFTIVIEDDGANGVIRVNWTGRGSSVDISPGEAILNPTSNGRLSMTRRISSGDAQYSSLYVRYSDELSVIEEASILASATLPADNVDAVLFNSYGTVKDFGPNNYGSYSHTHATGIGDSTGFGQRNEHGWSTEDSSGLVIPHRADNTPFTSGLNDTLTLTEVFDGPVAIDLEVSGSFYQQEERWFRDQVGDGGYQENAGVLADIDGTLYFEASKAQLGESLPYQASYAQNLMSWDDTGTLRTVLLDPSAPSYAADKLIVEEEAGLEFGITIGTTGFTGWSYYLYYTDDDTLIEKGVAASDVFTVPITLTADRPVELRWGKTDGIENFAQATARLASGAEIIPQLETATIYNANGIDGSTVTEYTFLPSGVLVEVDDLDNTTEFQRGYAAYRYLFNDPDNLIGDFFQALEPVNEIEYVWKLPVTVYNLDIVNTLIFSGGVWYNADGSSWIAPSDGVNYGAIEQQPRLGNFSAMLAPNTVTVAQLAAIGVK